ncbi:MAG: patatin-like phospholipase family protein [Burkholderiales bacterium]
MKIGIALGAGSARGWSHIGVLRALSEGGIEPEIVCGSSIGALVGAVYADDGLEALETWVTGLTWRGVMGFFDISLNGGFIKGAKLTRFLEENFLEKRIDELPRDYAAVATDFQNGREVWLRAGRVAEAVRASIALPGLFTPVERDGRLLVDGGLVNPVPVSLCRAMGADFVIAVDLSSAIVGRYAKGLGDEKRRGRLPSMVEVVAGSINIMQVQISRSRLAGEPADVVIAPQLGHLRMLDYHRAAEAIAEGKETTEIMLSQIRRLIEDQR